jgi:hypothetical protein
MPLISNVRTHHLMRTGFALPRKATTRVVAEWSVGIAIGMPVFYFLKGKDSSLLGLLAVFAIALAVVLALWFFLRGYKYVHLSEVGVYGRPTSGWKLLHISWSEPLTKEKASLNGLKGQLFRSQVSQKSVFIPQGILESPEFRACVAKHAPSNHALRAAEF